MFVKIDIKVNNMDKLSYYEKCIYERMFFLKPYLTHKLNDTGLSKYETMSSIQINQTVFDASMDEKKSI